MWNSENYLFPHCKIQNTILWHGKTCLRRKNHGDFCNDQIECTISGDPHLQCTNIGLHFKCLCSDKYEYGNDENGVKKCLKKFEVKKMDPKPNDNGMVTLGRMGFQ